jgi:hypothetical protein
MADPQGRARLVLAMPVILLCPEMHHLTPLAELRALQPEEGARISSRQCPLQ